ncbi:uncharacterized protein HMPREF1541_06584 [Cyphellophora europaea CBS 101466]|uniref:Zn(2)-C6 fungal-type domain-containing protein n=1 Tax=Cyphellophora europaea (strain CBS 101466) TaxID=1220924 RepID=W2RS38_CYPE1|nr:uncharacterized protein HMPREF1541_06584 [Cyphellophora europaea CBS 101466]ETN38548.1 hypothetical protein HMPREF1541_06584 [Cyphellophora europaea CBS 101466]
MVSPAPGKRQRRWAPKLRTGCISCKLRRLRCDEDKPVCKRCATAGFSCEWPTESGTNLAPKDTASDISDNLDASTTTTLVSPYSSGPDYLYLHFFTRHVAPLLSTTKQWHSVWLETIPQCAWTSDAVRNGMIALAASYETLRSGLDRATLVMQKTNLAIQAFRQESTDNTVALIMCRILASLAQAQEDWDTATTHMTWGAKILRQIDQANGKASDVAKTMAPTFMNALTESNDLHCAGRDLTLEQRQIWIELMSFRAKYRAVYAIWMARLWHKTNRLLKAYLLTTWSTLNHAISSALYPDLVFFTSDDPIIPHQKVAADLREAGQLLPLNELAPLSDAVLGDIGNFLEQVPSEEATNAELEARLRICVENYIVQAAIFEPRMTAGTYWSSNPEPKCAVELHMGRYTAADNIPPPEGAADPGNEMQNFYLEHVCPYRSGFLPVELDSCPVHRLRATSTASFNAHGP